MATTMVELVNYYDYEFHYHLGKANKVADVLSRKAVAFATTVEKMVPLQKDICSLKIEVVVQKVSSLTIQSTIMEAIKGVQLVDPQLEAIKQEVLLNKQSNFFILEDGVLGYKDG